MEVFAHHLILSVLHDSQGCVSQELEFCLWMAVEKEEGGDEPKALKQTLKIKTFVGTSAYAVRTQVWTALIAMLVLKYLQLKSSFSWSLSTLAALLRQQLFFYRDLWGWLDDPFESPPALAGVHDDAQQLGITW